MKNLVFILTLFFVISCKSDNNDVDIDVITDEVISEEDQHLDSLKEESISNYDMSTVDAENSAEFMEILVDIEKQYGVQWDFCTCVVKNDSINKAFAVELSDSDFDRLAERLDVIDVKCKAFLVQNPNVTPDERAEHEKKVKKCLTEANIH
ncbi:MAG: hypothetical protein QNK23_18655 [Crocinitomicaceae bacterium]|nr:hypothetical protein [Crocinitomicaceae bacterium]